MRKFACIFAIIIIVFCAGFPVYAEPDYSQSPNVTAPSVILIDSVTGQVLFEKNADKKMAPASMTKMITAIIAIENLDLTKELTVDKDAVKAGSMGSNAGLVDGEEISVDDLLYALMLPSANDAAVTLAKGVDGSIEEFAKRMNQKAKELGAKNTNFINSNGLDETNHYSTARDFAKIAKAVMTNETFRKYVGTASYTLPATNKTDAKKISNTNKMLTESKKEVSVYRTMRPIIFEGTTGIKTGHTEKAGYCLTASATRDGAELIAVVMGAREDMEYADVEELFEYGFHNYKMTAVVEKNKKLSSVTVTNGVEDKVNAVAYSDISVLAPLSGVGEDLRIEKSADKTVNAPVSKGDSLGIATVYYKDSKIGEVKLVASADVKSTSLKSTFKGAGKIVSVVIKVVIGIIIIFILWLIYSVITSTIKRRAKKKQKNFYGLQGYTSKEVKRIRRLK